MPKKLQAAGTLMKVRAKKASKNGSPSPTAQGNAVRVEHCEKSTPTDGEEERWPTEYVVDQVVERKVDGQCTLYDARWYDCGSSDDTWVAAEHLLQQFMARYEQCSRKKRKKIWR